MGLKNVFVICTRNEKFQPDEKFSTIISRAYASLDTFYTHTRQLCATKGCLLAMKGIYPEVEIAKMVQQQVHLDSVPLQIPQLEAQRHLIIMHPN